MAKTPLLTKKVDFETEIPNFAKVGDVVQSMLTEVQFQSERDSTWVLMDGSSIVGSEYEILTGNTNLPDARGVTLRGKNNGRNDGNENPDGELALGVYQADEIESHSHSVTVRSSSAGNGNFVDANPGQAPVGTSTEISNTGGNETRMKNITINHFIKINS